MCQSEDRFGCITLWDTVLSQCALGVLHSLENAEGHPDIPSIQKNC